MSVQALSQFREFAVEFTHAALSLICEVRFRATVDSFLLSRDCAGGGGSARYVDALDDFASLGLGRTV